MKITYVTGNWAKIKTAKLALEPLGFEIDNIKLETVEIQHDDLAEVAKYSAKWACEKLNCAVLKNDSGLCVNALNGFPAAYTHYADDTIGEDGLLKLMEGIEDRSAYFVECLAYCEPNCEPVVFKCYTKGTIAKEKSGTYGWSWDFVFIPEGKDKTLGCYPDDERLKMWNDECYIQLADYLNNKDDNKIVYNKLVRDNIPDIIKNNNEIPTTRILEDSEYKLELEKKLLEEYNEVIASSNNDRLEELADMLEIIDSLAALENSSLDEVIKIKETKKNKRGGFSKKIYLESVVKDERDTK